MKRKFTTKKLLIIISAAIICLLSCLFLWLKFIQHSNNNLNNSNSTNNIDNDNKHYNQLKNIKDVVKHKTFNLKIKELEQVINILEVDINSSNVKIKPVLAHNSIYGFELLSEIAGKHKAYAAINAGFFYEYGEPSGMVAVDGEIITGSTEKYPVFIMNEGKAELKQLVTELYLEFDTGQLQKLNKINMMGKPGEWVLFTRRYGTDNRVAQENFTIIIENNIIKEIIESNKETEIPKDGMVVTYIKPSRQHSNPSFIEGEKVKFKNKPDLSVEGQAYECGSWIIKDKQIVIGKKDPWIGVLTNRDPRTAIGIMETGEVVLITVDGRQPGYSYGLTAQELGEFLLQYGVKDAAMLDGGASTEMIIEGEIVNKPSFRGEERPLGGAIIVTF